MYSKYDYCSNKFINKYDLTSLIVYTLKSKLEERNEFGCCKTIHQSKKIICSEMKTINKKMSFQDTVKEGKVYSMRI